MKTIDMTKIEYLDVPVNFSCKLIDHEWGKSDEGNECITFTYEFMQFSHRFTVSFEVEKSTTDEQLLNALKRAATSMIFAKISKGIESDGKK